MARAGSAAPPAGDAAAAVAWLCHEHCSITGEAFTVGGGKIARVVLERGPSREADPSRIAAQRDAFTAEVARIAADADLAYARVLLRLSTRRAGAKEGK